LLVFFSVFGKNITAGFKCCCKKKFPDHSEIYQAGKFYEILASVFSPIFCENVTRRRLNQCTAETFCGEFGQNRFDLSAQNPSKTHETSDPSRMITLGRQKVSAARVCPPTGAHLIHNWFMRYSFEHLENETRKIIILLPFVVGTTSLK